MAITRTTVCLAAALLAGPFGPAKAPAVEVGPLVEALRTVGPNGAGHREAARAWQELVKADAAQLPQVLAGMDGAGPLAANWIAMAVETIAQRELNRGGTLPSAKLEQFVLGREHAPRARRLAYEYLVRVDPPAQGRLLAGMLDDPSLELRRDAVARVIGEAVQAAKRGEPAKAVPLYRKAFSAARDPDQIELLADRLRRAGQQVDLPRHFGFLLRWKLIGPFDNSDEKGFDVAYPPEREIEPAASYQGKGSPVKWTDCTTTDDYGKIDFNKAFGEQKAVVGYAVTEFVSDKQQEVELRLTTLNAVKLWLGGKLLDEHNVYHSGSQLDQYVARGVLRPGRNRILVKVCQNAQTQDWARSWGFQLRVCDERGTAILSADRDAADGRGDKK